MSSSENKWAFFRQGGWMVVATVSSGVFMSAVHVIVARMQPSEYAAFFTLLRVYLLMGIPTVGLQTVFTQQAASAITDAQARQLCQTTRSVLSWAFGVWLAVALMVFIFSGPLLEALKISNIGALWLTLPLALASLWMPVLRGLLQGSQNFLGLGWVMILDGLVRFSAIFIIVLFLGGQAAGGMLGAVIGQVVSILAAAWFTRSVWRGHGDSFAWGPWFRRVIPLTLGMGTILVISNIDVIFVQHFFTGNQRPLYMAGAMIGFALAQFTMPLAVVMYPKIAKSAARLQQTDAMRLTLQSTLVLGGIAALACTMFPKLPLQIIYFRNPDFVQASPLVPWFAWCLMIVSLANVLVGNLLARDKFRIVPWLVVIGGAYVATLWSLQPKLLQMETFAAFRTIVQILGGYSAILLLTGVWFTWGKAARLA